MLTVLLSEGEPDPDTLKRVIVEPEVIWNVVPPVPEPAPRITPPLALSLSCPMTRQVRGASWSAPRKPFVRGRAETALIAFCNAVLLSPPEGLSVRAVPTVGKATPPPMYPASEKSITRLLL